jgi:hypothetical protein
MKTYTSTNRAPDWASQSRVAHSDAKMDGLNRWSVQLMRRRSRYGAKYVVAEKRGWILFVSFGRLRGEIGTR